MSSIPQEIKESFIKGGIVVRLIYVNLAVFLVYNVIRAILFLAEVSTASFSQYLAVPAFLPNLASRPWTLITYMFFHEQFLHILFNLLWLYWFGKIFLGYMSERKLFGVYILGGVAGAFLYILSYNAFPVFSEVLPVSFALGASASVMAVVFAISSYAPNLSINLLFIGSVRLKYIALFVVILDIISIAGANAGGHIAHLGGALFGYLFTLSLKKGYDLTHPVTWLVDAFRPGAGSGRKAKMKVEYRRPMSDMEYNRVKKERQDEIDRILEKISRDGYNGLTAKEKEILFRKKDT